MENLRKLKNKIELLKKENKNICETQTTNSLVLDLFKNLAWDVFDFKSVIFEKKTEGKKRLDINLKSDNQNVIIEVKRFETELNGAHFEQLMNYVNTVKNCTYGILTNGNNYWIGDNSDGSKGNRDKKIYSLSIENLTNFNMEVLNFFSFGSFKNLNNLKKEIEYQELVKKLKKREEYQIFDKIKEENEKIIIGKNVSKKSKVKNSKNTEDYHIKKTNENLKNLYQKLRKNILAFDRNIEIFYRKLYISFKINNRSFLSVIFLKKSLKVIFGKKEIKIYDTKKICKDISEKGHWGTGDYQFHIEDEKDFDYKFNLIKNFFDFVKTKKK